MLLRSMLLLACCGMALMTGSTQAEEKLQVLIIDGQNNHNWQQTTPLLTKILESTGRFTVRVATSPAKGEDISTFQPDFTGVDVVVSNYNGALWPEATRTRFVEYVKNGGGFVCVHAANNAFSEWPEYNLLIGLGGWGGRNENSGPYVRFRDGQMVKDESAGRGGSHGSRHEFVVKTFDAEHSIMQGLPSEWLHTEDELYDRLRGPARNLGVLATAYSDPATNGSGEVEPMLMVLEHGKGRVFHTVLGHDITAMNCVGFQVTLQRGTEWAATGKVTLTKLPAKFPQPDKTVSRSFE